VKAEFLVNNVSTHRSYETLAHDLVGVSTARIEVNVAFLFVFSASMHFATREKLYNIFSTFLQY